MRWVLSVVDKSSSIERKNIKLYFKYILFDILYVNIVIILKKDFEIYY
jgi:hypothetical protein